MLFSETLEVNFVLIVSTEGNSKARSGLTSTYGTSSACKKNHFERLKNIGSFCLFCTFSDKDMYCDDKHTLASIRSNVFFDYIHSRGNFALLVEETNSLKFCHNNVKIFKN